MPMFSASIALFFLGMIAIETGFYITTASKQEVHWDYQNIPRGLPILIIPIAWLAVWVWLGHMIGFEPRVVFPLFRWLEVQRLLAAIVLILPAAVYCHGLLFIIEQFTPVGVRSLRASSIIVIFYMTGLVSITTILTILLTFIGNITGPMLVTGLITNYFLVAMLYTSVLMMTGRYFNGSRWSLAILSACILIWTLFSSMPLV